jgi:hypothetical protein
VKFFIKIFSRILERAEEESFNNNKSRSKKEKFSLQIPHPHLSLLLPSYFDDNL